MSYSLKENTLIDLSTQESVNFSTKHAALFLQLLVTCSHKGEALTFDMLSTAIQKDEPAYRLHRNQVLRMLADLTKAFETVGAKTRVLPKQKKRSSGPWKLSKTTEVFKVTAIDDESLSVESDFFDWSGYSETRSQALCRFIRIRLDAHVLAHEGYLDDVLIELTQCDEFPMKPKLRNLLDLLRIQLLSAIGDLDKSTALARKVIANATLEEDESVISFATYWLARAEYNRAPATSHVKLLQSSEPQAFMHCDEHAAMHWHNLNALLCRRKALATPNEAEHYFVQAQYHIEYSLFTAIRQNNIELTLDFMMNTAFFYQEFIPLGLASVEDVLPWYFLTMHYEDKMGFGNQASWGLVFLTEFYLSCQTAVEHSSVQKLLDKYDMNPCKLKFYEKTIPLIERSGDKRQLVTFLLLYFQFLSMKNEKMRLTIIARKTLKLIESEPPAFLTSLKKEGYKEHITQIRAQVKKKK